MRTYACDIRAGDVFGYLPPHLQNGMQKNDIFLALADSDTSLGPRCEIYVHRSSDGKIWSLLCAHGDPVWVFE